MNVKVASATGEVSNGPVSNGCGVSEHSQQQMIVDADQHRDSPCASGVCLCSAMALKSLIITPHCLNWTLFAVRWSLVAGIPEASELCPAEVRSIIIIF